MALNINSTAKLPSGYEIPLLGYGKLSPSYTNLLGYSDFSVWHGRLWFDVYIAAAPQTPSLLETRMDADHLSQACTKRKWIVVNQGQDVATDSK